MLRHSKKIGATASLPGSANLVHGAHCWTSQQWHPKNSTVTHYLAVVSCGAPSSKSHEVFPVRV
jgi:hypothetical protein